MGLKTPKIQMAPQPPLKTYVGLETWLWMQPDAFQTLKLTVSAGATSVTATAEPVEATWEMGEGGTETCTDAGTPWRKGMSSDAITDCAYTYDHTSKGGSFTVKSTLTYDVDWTCSGACLLGSGTLGDHNGGTGTQSIRVSERQSVNTK